MKKTRAISLVELMVTTAIFTLVAGGIYGAFTVGLRSWTAYSNSVGLQREARGALFAMTKELRDAYNILITEDSNGVTLSFARPTIGMVTYAWNDNGRNANKIIRQDESQGRVLASNISSISFNYLANAILIDITASRIPTMGQAINFHLKEKIALRSKIGFFKPPRKDHGKIKQ